nr:hypothetical protein [Tanacetum cinerariifolium]
MSILSGRKSVPGKNSRNRGKWKEKTTRSSRELHGCAFLRKKFKEDLFASGIEHGILQDSSEPSNDNSNVVNAPREPFVVNLDPGNNSSQSPPQISNHYCYGCGDPLEEDMKQQYLDEMKRLINSDYHDETKIAKLKQNFNGMSIEIRKKEKLQQLEQVSNLSTYPSKRLNSFCYDDDDDDEDYNFAITPNKPDNSLSMRDEHPDTISATKSDEFIKSSVENLVPIPSESEGESECDMPFCEGFTTFSNILFDADYEFDSSDYQSCSHEDVTEKIFSNPLFDEEIIPMKIDQHHYNAESDLIESMRTHDSSIIISSKIDSLLDEFAGELTLLKSIPPGIDELIVILRMKFVLSRDCCTITQLLVLRKNLFLKILMLKLNLSLHLLSPRIVTLMERTIISWMFFYFIFIPLDQFKYGGIWSS